MRREKAGYFLLFTIFIPLVLIGNINAAENFLDRGISEYKAENFEEALELLIKAREQQPDSSLAAFYLGMTYKQTGDLKEAAKNLKEAILLTPSVIDAYTELIEVLYNQNELKEAKDWIARAEKEGIKPANISFLKGLVLSKEDKNKAAIEAFKKAKEIDPSLSQACDLQIAMVYAKQRRFAQAKDNLKALISVDPTSELASFAKEYDEAFTRGMEMYKPWRVTAGISYQYDDNVVLKPSTAIPGVVISGERDSSVIPTFRIDYNPLLKDPWFLNLGYNFYGNFHEDVKTYDLLSQTISLNPGYNFQKGALTLPLAFSYIWLHSKEYMWVGLAKPTMNLMFLPNHIGQFSIGYSRREMINRPIDRNEERDGNIYFVSPGYFYSFSDGRGMVNLKYEFSKDLTEGKNWENTGYKFDLSLLVPLIYKVSATASGEIFWQYYDHKHTVFDVVRRDKTYTGSAGVLWEILKGLNLSLQYSHTTADSNIAVYDYKRNVYTMGVEYTF